MLVVHLLTAHSLLHATYKPRAEKVIIGGIAQNIAPYLPFMINKIESLGACFKDYRVIVYENNSYDDSSSLLISWAQSNSKVIMFSENVTQEQLDKRGRSRTERIAYARNVVLQRALQEDLNDFNFVIITDMDFVQGWEVKDVIASFKLPIEWDCITANGILGTRDYYDRYAYRDAKFPLGPELLGDHFWVGVSTEPIRFVEGSPLHKVYSAFGGIALYKKEAMRDCIYGGIETPEYKKFLFILLNFKVKPNHREHVYYKRKVKSSDYLLPIQFCGNTLHAEHVVCEHVTFHASMALRGHDKIYVNPDLVCVY